MLYTLFCESKTLFSRRPWWKPDDESVSSTYILWVFLDIELQFFKSCSQQSNWIQRFLGTKKYVYFCRERENAQRPFAALNTYLRKLEKVVISSSVTHIKYFENLNSSFVIKRFNSMCVWSDKFAFLMPIKLVVLNPNLDKRIVETKKKNGLNFFSRSSSRYASLA